MLRASLCKMEIGFGAIDTDANENFFDCLNSIAGMEWKAEAVYTTASLDEWYQQ